MDTLKNLKILKFNRNSELTVTILKDAFQDLMLKCTGLYIHCDQIFLDVDDVPNINAISYNHSLEIYWAEFCKNNEPMYSRYICDLNSDYYFNIRYIIDLLYKDDIDTFYNVLENFIKCIIKADMYQNSGLILNEM